MTAAALLDLGADVRWPDAEAAGAARTHTDRPAGRLGELVEWLSATQGKFRPELPRRARCIVLGSASDPLVELAATLDIGVVSVELPVDAAAALSLGVQTADDEIEAGADLLVLAGHDDAPAPAAVVSVIAGAEPVALLPRGAAAVDTARWVDDATRMRSLRRRIVQLRASPDELLAELGSPGLATAAGFALRAAARRTPLVLDGTAAVAAGLLCADSQPRAREWWQVADTSPDRAHARAREQLELRPLLDLGTDTGDGIAGALAVAVLHAAVVASGRDE
ncbi:MAG TPA: nicotinate-nucleotide--dimethylbenzimidazole phosphoribosyltransferase [Jatrophihabitans sp.]|nr:nicotinate-nucleotide--dimethylbenzimidazole phosphoribosyltransferase [Jatrophihabitans sp.]